MTCFEDLIYSTSVLLSLPWNRGTSVSGENNTSMSGKGGSKNNSPVHGFPLLFQPLDLRPQIIAEHDISASMAVSL
jgi:hypothetical protein